MDSPELKLQTKREVIVVLDAIPKASSLEKAKEVFPQDVYHYIEHQVMYSKVDYTTVLDTLKRDISALKEIKVYLAFEPSQLLVEKMIQEFDAITPHRYLDIVVDETILGGVKVVLDGKIFDASLDTMVDTMQPPTL